jgi:hypothetical protein
MKRIIFFLISVVSTIAYGQVNCRSLLSDKVESPVVVREGESTVLIYNDAKGTIRRQALSDSTFYSKTLNADTVVTAFHTIAGGRPHTIAILWRRGEDGFKMAKTPMLWGRHADFLEVSQSGKFLASFVNGQDSGRPWVEVVITPMDGGLTETWYPNVGSLHPSQIKSSRFTDDGKLTLVVEVGGQLQTIEKSYKP